MSGTFTVVAGSVDQLSDEFVESYAALDPVMATFEGIPGYDSQLTDYSPDGTAERLEHANHVRRKLDAIAPSDAGFRWAGFPSHHPP